MNFRARHLNDEQLFECYLAQRDGSVLDPRPAEHLTDCAECGVRFGELLQLMDALRSEADAETDAAFPVEWRQRQQQQIGGRLEHLGHLARVLSFPTRHGDDAGRGGTRVAPRWVAAAAAAGLFVGIALGNYYELSRRGASGRTVGPVVSSPARASASPPAAVSPNGLSEVQVGLDDDKFLSELELAVDSLHARELMPFYAFTPTVMEASAQLR